MHSKKNYRDNGIKPPPWKEELDPPLGLNGIITTKV